MDGLKTLHVNTERGWRGGEQQTLYLLTALRAAGQGAELVCRAGGVLAERAAAAGVITHFVRPLGEYDLLAARRIARLIRREGFDVIHAHTSHAHTLATLAAGLTPRPQRPACIVSRRVDFHLRRGPFGFRLLKYRWGVDAYVAISECIRQVMIADGIAAEKIHRVYSAVDLRRYEGVKPAPLRQQFGIPADAPLLVNVAMLVGHKGQRHLVDAVPLLLRRYPALQVVIVGEGELRALLMAQTQALGVADHVHFAGFRDDPLACIAAANVFAMTSQTEGLCTSILDAFGLKIPVVATRAGGIPEIVRHESTGLLAENGNAEDIARQVGRLLDGADRRKKCVAGAAVLLREQFTVEQMAAGNLAVYEQTLLARGQTVR